jgi:hypothetical protein
VDINDILKDPESLQNIKELAEMFKDEFDIGENTDILSLIGSLTGSPQSNKNTELLLALKPHLSEQKQYKVEKAIKLLGLLETFTTLKDAGILEDLL